MDDEGAHNAAPQQDHSDPDRFVVTTYVPPEPEVRFAGRRRPSANEREARRRRSRRRRIVSWSLIAAGAVVLLGAGWVTFRAYQAFTNLDAAAAKVQELQGQLTASATIDEATVRPTVAALQGDAAAARAAVEDPLYRAATFIPVIGPNLDAVGQMGVTVESLARDVMPSLVDVATSLRPASLRPVDGRIPLERIEEISPALQSADRAIDDALSSLGAIDRSRLVQPVAAAVTEAGQKLQQAADVTDPAARVTRLAPAMLGADGPRQWLVVFQNPAEPRATGGIFGSFALVRADQGRIDIVDQGASSRVLGQFDPPIAELTENEVRSFGTLLARFPQDTNLTPNFPRAAQLFTQMYTARTGAAVDGVVAVDPVVLSYMLRDSPAVVVDGISLDSTNLVKTVLSTAYNVFEGRDQSARDDFLAAASSSVFTRVMGGGADYGAVIDGLRQGVRERRVLLFSANSSEQDDLASTDLAGVLDAAGPGPEIGVFLNDATAAKLGYYLKPAVAVTEADCRGDGRRLLQVAVTLTSGAPPDDKPLPPYVTGSTALGALHGVRTNVLVMAPLGGGIVSATQDGQPIALRRGEDLTRELATVAVELLPGESRTVVVTVLSPVGNPATDVAPAVVTTPGVNPWEISVEPYRVCRQLGGS